MTLLDVIEKLTDVKAILLVRNKSTGEFEFVNLNNDK